MPGWRRFHRFRFGSEYLISLVLVVFAVLIMRSAIRTLHQPVSLALHAKQELVQRIDAVSCRHDRTIRRSTLFS